MEVFLINHGLYIVIIFYEGLLLLYFRAMMEKPLRGADSGLFDGYMT